MVGSLRGYVSFRVCVKSTDSSNKTGGIDTNYFIEVYFLGIVVVESDIIEFT